LLSISVVSPGSQFVVVNAPQTVAAGAARTLPDARVVLPRPAAEERSIAGKETDAWHGPAVRWHRGGSGGRHAPTMDAVQTELSAPIGDGDLVATRRGELGVVISIRTILLVAAVVAVVAALASIRSVLLVIFVSVFGVAVLSPIATALERRLGWSRRLCATVIVLAVVAVIAGVTLVMAQAVSDAVRGLSHDLPQIVEQARHSPTGSFINRGNGSLDTLLKHAGDLTAGARRVSGGVVHVGISAFSAVTVVSSVVFLTLFGLIDEPNLRRWTGGLLYRDKRERYLRVTDRIVNTTSRYMLGNLAISVICGIVYGITAAILGLPYPLALAVIAAILDLVPNIGATLAGAIIALVSLSVSLEAMIAFLVVIVIYQQVENYILQPTIIGKAAKISGFTVLASVLAFGSLFGLVGAIIGVPIAAGLQIVVEELTAGRRARIAAADAGV
jgi:predicted PurR-regulated permease PerM